MATMGTKTKKPSLADRLYEAWEFAGNFGRRKH